MDDRRRNMDIDYVTRREWEMHIRAGDSRDTRISKHLTSQDDKIDALESAIYKLIGGMGVAIVGVQIITTIILSSGQ